MHPGLLVLRLAFYDLSKDTVVARGRWQLERAADKPWGRFVLVMRYVEGAWRVVIDFTTRGG